MVFLCSLECMVKLTPHHHQGGEKLTGLLTVPVVEFSLTVYNMSEYFHFSQFLTCVYLKTLAP